MSIEKRTDFIVKRTPQEVKARLELIEKTIDGNDVWIHTGAGQIREPKTKAKLENLEAQKRTLEWLLGDEVEIQDLI